MKPAWSVVRYGALFYGIRHAIGNSHTDLATHVAETIVGEF